MLFVTLWVVGCGAEGVLRALLILEVTPAAPP